VTSENQGFLGEREFRLMPEGSLFILLSRAGVVDFPAMLAAAGSGRIRVATDVFPEEPLPAGHPLLSMSNVVLTPHLGYVTRENYAVFYRDALEDILAWHAGAPVRLLT
jgi:phosphoglycerate dehydrogenase-like enzyme